MAEGISIGIELEGGDEVEKQLAATEEKIKDVAKATEDLHDTDGSIKIEAPGAVQAADEIKQVDEALKSAKTSADDLGGSLQGLQSSAGGAGGTGLLDPVSQSATIASASMDAVQLAMHRAETAFESLGAASLKLGARMTRSLGLFGVLARAFGPVGIAAGVVAGAIVKFGNDSAKALSALNVEAAKLDLTTQKFDTLQKALTSLGVDSGSITGGLQKLKETLSQGFFSQDIITGLQQFIATLERMPDGVERTQLAFKTLGDALGGQVIAGLQTGTISAQNFATALNSVTPATQQQIIEAAKYEQALNRLGAAWTELKSAFAPITTPVLQFLTQELQNLKKDIQEIIKEFMFLKAVFDVFKAGITGGDMDAAAKQAAEAYNRLGQAAAQAGQQAAEGNQAIAQTAKTAEQAVVQLGTTGVQAVQSIGPALQVVQNALTGFFEFVQKTGPAAAQIPQQMAQGLQAVRNPLTGFFTLINQTGQAATQAGGEMVKANNSAANSAQNATSKVGELEAAYIRMGSTAQRVKQFLAFPQDPMTGQRNIDAYDPANYYASGGLMGGRGTGNSDSNLAWLSRGEHIMPARAVQQPGVLSFLEALRRSGGNLSRVLDGMGRFALGGMVPRMPAFATGGLAGGSNVTIQFPGLPPISGLRASSNVVEQLHRAAALAQVRSGGRKPSRYS